MRLLTVEETARMLGLSPDTIRKMSQRGDIPCIKISYKVMRFDQDALRQWLKSKERPVKGYSENES